MLRFLIGLLLLSLASCGFYLNYPGANQTFLTGANNVTSFGYFSTDTYMNEVKDHSNMIWTSAGSWDKLTQIQQIYSGAVIDITGLFFDGGLNLNSDYQDQWDSFLSQLQPYLASNPKFVQAFYLVDEPYGSAKRAGVSRDEIRSRIETAISYIKNQSSNPNIPIATIFGDSELLWNFSIPKGYDWVGMDCYGGFDSCDFLPANLYLDILHSNMNSKQRMILVPGTMVFQKETYEPKDVQDAIGWFKQYYNYARRNPELVAAIWGFLWPTTAGVEAIDTGARDLPAMQIAVSDLMHLSQFHGRPEFDADVYRTASGFAGTDLAAYQNWMSGGSSNPTSGLSEGTRSSLIFDLPFYTTLSSVLNPSVNLSSNQAVLQYWILHGENQSVPTSAEFDSDFYLRANPAIAQAVGGVGNYKGGLTNWYQTGLQNGLRTSPAFDIRYYAAELGQQGNYANAWKSWLAQNGNDSTPPSNEFNPGFYLDNCPAVKNLKGSRYQNKAAVNYWLAVALTVNPTNGYISPAAARVSINPNTGQPAVGGSGTGGPAPLPPGCQQGSANFDPAAYLHEHPALAQQIGAYNYRGALIDWLVNGGGKNDN